MQTFLVVKGRNLQLSNKSLRLDPLRHWLQLTTWRTLYEHELYAVVYSLVLPLYQQQTKLWGVETSFPFPAPARLQQIPHGLLAPLRAIMAGFATS